jgi:hypothetical protein
MDSHPAEVLGISIWNFFEDQSSYRFSKRMASGDLLSTASDLHPRLHPQSKTGFLIG